MIQIYCPNADTLLSKITITDAVDRFIDVDHEQYLDGYDTINSDGEKIISYELDILAAILLTHSVVGYAIDLSKAQTKIAELEEKVKIQYDAHKVKDAEIEQLKLDLDLAKIREDKREEQVDWLMEEKNKQVKLAQEASNRASNHFHDKEIMKERAKSIAQELVKLTARLREIE